MKVPVVRCLDCPAFVDAHIVEYAHLYPDALLIVADMILEEHRKAHARVIQKGDAE